MKHSIAALLLIFVAMPFLAACSEDDNTEQEYANWQQKNDSYWNELYSTTQQRVAAGDNSWRILRTWSKNDGASLKSTDYIIAHVEQEGQGTLSPLYTDTVRVHYAGRLIPSPSYAEGYQFDQSFTGTLDTRSAMPYKSAASSFVDGFATAVTNMHVGDRWTVYIPYALGYGATGSGTSIPAYSVLIFDISLAAFYHPGATVPDWNAKQAFWEP